MCGPYKFEISLEEYEAWLERVRDTHGSDTIAIMLGMKDMLLITEIEENLTNDTDTEEAEADTSGTDNATTVEE